MHIFMGNFNHTHRIVGLENLGQWGFDCYGCKAEQFGVMYVCVCLCVFVFAPEFINIFSLRKRKEIKIKKDTGTKSIGR